MHFSGSDNSFSEDEFSEREDSLAIADPQSRVPVSPSSSSSSYAAFVYRYDFSYRLRPYYGERAARDDRGRRLLSPVSFRQ